MKQILNILSGVFIPRYIYVVISSLLNKFKSKKNNKKEYTTRFKSRGFKSNNIRFKKSNSIEYNKHSKKPKITEKKADTIIDTIKSDYSIKENNKSCSNIKSFKEFINPSDNLKLKLKCGNTITYNMKTCDLLINDNKTGANIENITGITYLGDSKIDGNSIIGLKIKGEKNILLLRVIKGSNRFESVRDTNDYYIMDSNIDSVESHSKILNSQIVNGKIYV